MTANPHDTHKIIKRAFAFLAAVLILACGIFLIYANDYHHADDRAISIVEKYNTAPADSGYVAFGESDSEAALIFYPGAKVEYTAYAPFLNNVAQKGYLCVVVEVPLKFAFFATGAASEVMADYPDVERWFIGGHSLGGVVAASYAAKHTDGLEGLIMVASYSATDLSATDLRVLSIFGANDLRFEAQTLEKARENMPITYTEYVIEGANHSNFGNYGSRDVDGVATITAEEQQRIASEVVAEFME
ncbi:MAG: lysophospholipase [Actinobacteria bacterium]|nr:lysophospholipase [Actinomycetota bacterium]